jgi:hypothetical protein
VLHQLLVLDLIHLFISDFKVAMIKKIIYIAFIILLFVPLMQKGFKIFPEKPLMGDFYSKTDTVFTLPTWFNGHYHIQKEAFIDENFGGRNFFIRLNNQVLFSLFGISKANNVIVGKENYLFGLDYIKSFMGKDFIGDDKIEKNVNDLSLINDELRKHSKILLIIITPNKCYYYSEYLPDKYNSPGTQTNYKSYTNALSKSNIFFIDFHSWFMEQKSKTNYLLFPKTGIHWSNYSASLAADSTVKYLRNKTNLDLSGFSIEKIETTNVARNPDQDIEDGSNLLFKIKKPEFAYPVIKPDSNSKKKLKAFVISDSYYWNWNWYGLDTMMFKDPMMGYYYSDVYDIKAGRNVISAVSKYGLGSLIDNSEIIVLMTTEGKLESFPWGFTDAAKKELFGNKMDPIKKEKFIQKIIAKIKNDKAWHNVVSKKAAERKIDIEKMLVMDAEYVVSQEYQNLLVEDYIEIIRNDKKWLESVEQKAKDQKIPLNEMIRKDAVWSAEQEIGK